MVYLWHRAQNFLVATKPCKCLFTNHCVEILIIFLQLLWAVLHLTLFVYMIVNMECINDFSKCILPNVFEISWEWQWSLRNSQIVQVAHVVIGKCDALPCFPGLVSKCSN